MNQYGMMTDEDVPQAEWASGTTKDAGKTPPPVSNLTSASYKTQQTGSVLDSFEGTGVVSAFDPRTNATVSPYQLATMRPEEREGIVLTFSDKPQVTIAQARALGWTPTTGPFADRAATSEGQPQQQPEQQEQQQEPEEHPDLRLEGFSKEDQAAETSLTEVLNNTSPLEQIQAIHQMADEGTISDTTLIALASQMGIQQDEAVERAHAITDAFKRQAEAAMSDEAPGVDVDEIVAWAFANRESKFKEAMKHHGMARQTKGYREIAREYYSTMDDHSPDKLLSANFGEGVRAYRDGNNIVLDIPGRGTFTWKSLVKAGFVGKPTRNS